MKHVFIIASHTSFLSAIGTAEYLKLKAEEVIILGMRNYKNSVVKHPYRFIDVTGIMDMPTSEYSEKEDMVQTIDEFIDKNIHEKFHLYAPHMSNMKWKVFYTNHYCLDFAYIQEGGWPFKSAYITNPTLKSRLRYFLEYKLRNKYRRTWTRGWYFKGSLYKQNEIHSFALNNQFFEYLPSINHIIKWPVCDVKVDIVPNSMIFIFDGYVGNKMLEADLYMKVCERLIKECARDSNYVKFHPAQTKEERETILNMFSSQDMSYQLMRDDIPMEFIISSKKNLNFAGFTSSLIFFARDFGHNVTSHQDWLMESPRFQRFIESNVGVKK